MLFLLKHEILKQDKNKQTTINSPIHYILELLLVVVCNSSLRYIHVV